MSRLLAKSPSMLREGSPIATSSKLPPWGQFHPVHEIPERDLLDGALVGAGSLKPYPLNTVLSVRVRWFGQTLLRQQNWECATVLGRGPRSVPKNWPGKPAVQPGLQRRCGNNLAPYGAWTLNLGKQVDYTTTFMIHLRYKTITIVEPDSRTKSVRLLCRKSVVFRKFYLKRLAHPARRNYPAKSSNQEANFSCYVHAFLVFVYLQIRWVPQLYFVAFQDFYSPSLQRISCTREFWVLTVGSSPTSVLRVWPEMTKFYSSELQ
jgi:hypothetical protein